MKNFLVVIFITSAFSAAGFYPAYGTAEDLTVVSVKAGPGILSKLGELHLDLLMEKEGRIYLVAGPHDLAGLFRTGIPYKNESSLFPARPPRNISIQSGINGAYHSYPEVEQEMIEMENLHPDLSKLEIIGQSHELRNLYALKISDNPQSDEDEAEVLFIGCHHAREWISVEVPLYLARYLLENYSSDPEIRSLVDSSEIWIIPLLNPDGLEYSIYFFRYWRKNRRDNGNGSFGVDLNRNYGYKWGYDSTGSSSDPNSPVYRGPDPFSEPESKAVRSLAATHDFQALISYHNYSQIILFPWGYTGDRPREYELLYNLAQTMSRLMEPVNGRNYNFGQAAQASYLLNGSTTDWALGTYGIPSFTLELPPQNYLGGGFFNSEEDILPICRENLPAALFLIEWAVSRYEKNKERGLPFLNKNPHRGRRK